MFLLSFPRVLRRLLVPDLAPDPFQVPLLLLGEGVVGGEDDPLLLAQLLLFVVEVEPGVFSPNWFARHKDVGRFVRLARVV